MFDNLKIFIKEKNYDKIFLIIDIYQIISIFFIFKIIDFWTHSMMLYMKNNLFN
jgi:uncharacterized membrane protein